MTIEELINTGEQFEIKTEPTSMQEGPLGYTMIVEGYQYLPQSDKFATWLQQCIRFISLNYPKDFSVEEFQKIEIENVTQGTIYKLIGILKALKDNPVICEKNIQTPSTSNSITINQSQSQNQSQTFSLVLEALKEELKGKEYHEIERIVTSEMPKEEKKRSIITKLMNFGENVAASILATLLTSGY